MVSANVKSSTQKKKAKATTKPKPKAKVAREEQLDLSTLNPIERLELSKDNDNRRARFAREYVARGLNKISAANVVGYAFTTAHTLIHSPGPVKDAIHWLIKEEAERLNVNPSKVLTELALVAFQDPRNLFDEQGTLKAINDLPWYVARTISSMEVSTHIAEDGTSTTHVAKIKFNDKLTALNTLARHLNMFDADNQSKATALSDILRDIDGSSRGLPMLTNHDDLYLE
jgi:hypothetical protein